MAADERGNVTACWLADKLYANVSHDHGATFEPTVEINTELNPCKVCPGGPLSHLKISGKSG